MKEQSVNPTPMQPAESPLYIVALPEGPVQEQALIWQRQLIERFPIYTREPFPPLHVTLATLMPPGEKLPEVIQCVRDICQEEKPIAFRTTGIGCFGQPSLAVTLYIERSKALFHLTETIHRSLAFTGLLRASAVPHWAYHITLSSAITADDPWDEPTFARACYLETVQSVPLEGKLTSIALWYPEFRPLAEIDRFLLGKNTERSEKG